MFLTWFQKHNESISYTQTQGRMQRLLKKLSSTGPLRINYSFFRKTMIHQHNPLVLQMHLGFYFPPHHFVQALPVFYKLLILILSFRCPRKTIQGNSTDNKNMKTCMKEKYMHPCNHNLFVYILGKGREGKRGCTNSTHIIIST